MLSLRPEEQQVVASFRQLRPERRRYVLLEMARSDPDALKQFQPDGQFRLREAARERGLGWEAMDDDQRQDFIEEFLDGQNP